MILDGQVPGAVAALGVSRPSGNGGPAQKLATSRRSLTYLRGLIAFTQIHPDEKAPSAIDHLKASVAYCQSLGVAVWRVLTDNGTCYKSHAFRNVCHELGIKHIRTSPSTPRTNGKAERFIQTALR